MTEATKQDALLASVNDAVLALAQAREARDAAIRSAKDGGCSLRDIAAAALMTKTGVDNVLRRTKEES